MPGLVKRRAEERAICEGKKSGQQSGALIAELQVDPRMTAFRIAGFSGLVPRLAKQLLAPNQAQVATNCKLTSGDLRPMEWPAACIFARHRQGDIVSMFRMEKDGNEKWLAWDKDVDVARSPVAGNTSRRFYYTGDGEPRASDYDMATAGSLGPYPSGLLCAGRDAAGYRARRSTGRRHR